MKRISESDPATPPIEKVDCVLLIGAPATRRDALRGKLLRLAHEVVPVARAAELPRHLRRERTSAAIVYLDALGERGLTHIRDLRSHGSLPILALTDAKEEVVEVVALKYGADMVASGASSPLTIVERLAAVLRRNSLISGDGENAEDFLRRGDLVMNLLTFDVMWKGVPVTLTRTEFALLRFLAERPGHLRSRDQIYDELYGDDIHVLDRTIDSHIKRIRRKMKDADAEFDSIDTLYGMGYRFRADADTRMTA